MKGRVRMDPSFMNKMDGFSTMAPLLFHLDDGKNRSEGGGGMTTTTTLRGPSNIGDSLTAGSTTLLLDVDERKLVPHSAERDVLLSDGRESSSSGSSSPTSSLVVVQPALPLRHGGHYALAVVGASPGPLAAAAFANLLRCSERREEGGGDDGDDDDRDCGGAQEEERSRRFKRTILPALADAAPWLVDGGAEAEEEEEWWRDDGRRSDRRLGLLFDFRTASAESQLGPIRAVRDATVAALEGGVSGGVGEGSPPSSSSKWDFDPLVVGMRDFDCSAAAVGTAVVARTVHIDIAVPWFLDGIGPGARGAALDEDRLFDDEDEASSGGGTVAPHPPTGRAKFVAHVPCSVKQSALRRRDDDLGGGVDLDDVDVRSILDYGHGLFGSRAEASVSFLNRMAHENRYLILAMDWRGMSVYDLPIMVKTLMSRPSDITVVRDNIIQGYANKLSMQYFSRSGGMLEMDCFRFGSGGEDERKASSLSWSGNSTFYGISQGGILGAGYSALAAKTGWIDRSVLGVPGTPFSFILPRSLDFKGYDSILLTNFYNNEAVRIFLSVIQIAYDSVEASGLLATPKDEPTPHALLQAGMGDAEVSYLAAEALARAYDAVILPSNDREIFGVPEMTTVAYDDGMIHTNVLTEIYYREEYESIGDDGRVPRNGVHEGVRQDPAMMEQVSAFINYGTVVDACVLDHCVRQSAS